MSTPSGEDPATGGNSDKASAARANSRTTIAAFETVGGYARAEALPADALPPATRRSPAEDPARLARTLCALRHLADQFPALSFGHVLNAANEQYRLFGTGSARPATARNARMADEAIGTCDRGTTAPRSHDSGFWPPDTLSYLHAYASSHGLSFESAVRDLTTRLLADLRHYADHQGIDFQEALATGVRAHAWQRLRAEGPFETGVEPGRLPASVSFHPVATNQGVVVSQGDAEWLLIRTAARTQESWKKGLPPDRRDADDERVLANALAEARGQAPLGIFSGLEPQIAARVMQIEDGPATAAELGRVHGRTGTLPYCDLEINGDATALLQALGETEWTTGANHPHRLSLVTAYAEAYQQAAGRGPAPVESPARIAARDHPSTGQPPASPAGTDPPGCGGPPASPRHGSRRGAR
jgi:hypothetical protein